MTFIWKSQTASSDQNAVLLSKAAKSLAGGGAAPVMSQERSAASEELERNVFSGTLAKSRKLTSILKYHFAFPSCLQNYLGPKKPTKMSAWIFSQARSFLQERERCCSGGCSMGCKAPCCTVQTIDTGKL